MASRDNQRKSIRTIPFIVNYKTEKSVQFLKDRMDSDDLKHLLWSACGPGIYTVVA